MNEAVLPEEQPVKPARTAVGVLVVVITAVILEVGVLFIGGAGLYALTGPCTIEYTPQLQEGSPRDQICEDPGALWLLLGAGALAVPLAAAFGLWRLRTTWARLVALLVAVLLAAASLVGFIRIIHTYSTTTSHPEPPDVVHHQPPVTPVPEQR